MAQRKGREEIRLPDSNPFQPIYSTLYCTNSISWFAKSWSCLTSWSKCSADPQCGISWTLQRVGWAALLNHTCLSWSRSDNQLICNDDSAICWVGTADPRWRIVWRLAVLLWDSDGDGLDLCVGLQAVLAQLSTNPRHLIQHSCNDSVHLFFYFCQHFSFMRSFSLSIAFSGLFYFCQPWSLSGTLT